MPQSNNQKTKWEVGQGRFTLFYPPNAPITPPQFKTLTGGRDSDEKSQQGPIQSQSGTYNSVSLAINNQPGRVDIIIGPSPGTQNDLGYSAFGTIDGPIKILSELAPKSYRSTAKVNRIAVALLLIAPGGGTVENAALSLRDDVKYLRDIPEDIAELSFTLSLRKNLPTRHPIAVYRRLSWRTALVTTFAVPPLIGGSIQIMNIAATRPVPVKQLEIDINTVPLQPPKVFQRQQIREITDQLLETARLAAEQGYAE